MNSFVDAHTRCGALRDDVQFQARFAVIVLPAVPADVQDISAELRESIRLIDRRLDGELNFRDDRGYFVIGVVSDEHQPLYASPRVRVV